MPLLFLSVDRLRYWFVDFKTTFPIATQSYLGYPGIAWCFSDLRLSSQVVSWFTNPSQFVLSLTHNFTALNSMILSSYSAPLPQFSRTKYSSPTLRDLDFDQSSMVYSFTRWSLVRIMFMSRTHILSEHSANQAQKNRSNLQLENQLDSLASFVSWFLSRLILVKDIFWTRSPCSSCSCLLCLGLFYYCVISSKTNRLAKLFYIWSCRVLLWHVWSFVELDAAPLKPYIALCFSLESSVYGCQLNYYFCWVQRILSLPLL